MFGEIKKTNYESNSWFFGGMFTCENEFYSLFLEAIKKVELTIIIVLVLTSQKI